MDTGVRIERVSMALAERSSASPRLLELFAGGSRSYLGNKDGAVLQDFQRLSEKH